MNRLFTIKRVDLQRPCHRLVRLGQVLDREPGRAGAAGEGEDAVIGIGRQSSLTQKTVPPDAVAGASVPDDADTLKVKRLVGPDDADVRPVDGEVDVVGRCKLVAPLGRVAPAVVDHLKAVGVADLDLQTRPGRQVVGDVHVDRGMVGVAEGLIRHLEREVPHPRPVVVAFGRSPCRLARAFGELDGPGLGKAAERREPLFFRRLSVEDDFHHINARHGPELVERRIAPVAVSPRRRDDRCEADCDSKQKKGEAKFHIRKVVDVVARVQPADRREAIHAVHIVPRSASPSRT